MNSSVLAERRAQPIDIAIEYRGQIGIDQSGIAAADQLDQRCDTVADRNLLESDRPSARSASAASCPVNR